MDQKLAGKKYSQNIVTIIKILLTVSAASFLIFFFSARFPGMKYTFVRSDALAQYAPFSRLCWKTFFSNDHSGYSFSIGMGSPTVPVFSFSYYSPFNSLFAIMQDMELATMFVYLLKIAMASITFFLWIRFKYGGDRSINIVLSSAYGLSGFSLGYYSNINFLDCLYILPLLFLVLSKFKLISGKLMAITVFAYAFMINFYFGYQLGIFGLLYYLCVVFFESGKGSEKVKHMCEFALCAIVAALLSAPVTIPTAVYLFDNLAEDRTVFKGTGITMVSFLRNLFIGTSVENGNGAPLLYSGVTGLIILPLFFKSKMVEKKQKIIVMIMAVFLFLLTFIEPMYLFIHAFDAPDSFPFRYAYVFSFILLSVTARGIKKEILLQKDRIIPMMATGLAMVCILSLVVTKTGTVVIAVNLLFILIYILGYLKLSDINVAIARKILPIMIFAEIVINGVLSVKQIEPALSENRNVYELWVKENSEFKKIVCNSGEEEFSRVSYQNPLTDNYGSLLGLYGTGYFATFENVKVRNEMSKLGYAASPRVLHDYGGTKFTRMIFGQKYLALGTDPRFGEIPQSVKVEINDRSLGIGFMVSEKLNEFSASSDNVFDNLNSLAGHMLGGECDVFDIYSGSVEVNEKKENGILVRVYNAPGSENAGYAYFPQNRSIALSDSPRTGSENGDYGSLVTQSYLSMPHIIFMGQDTPKNSVMVLSDSTSRQDIYADKVYFAYDNIENINKAYDELKSGIWHVNRSKDGTLIGNVVASKERPLLFVSVPFDKNWKVFVDGSETEYTSVMDGTFIAVDLTPGEHNVELKYINEINKIAWVLCMCGVAILIGFTVIYCHCRHEKKLL